MTKLIDLHIHSNFSEDADFSVNEIFSLASDLSLSAISITDHDSLESITSAKLVKNRYEVEYIPGIEVTTIFSEDGSQQHILGYFVNEQSIELKSILKEIHELRFNVAKKRIEALQRIGFDLDEDKVWEMTGNRPPTATSIMLEVFNNKKNSSDIRLKDYFYGDKGNNRLSHFYREFFTVGKKAYVPFESISIEDGIDIIKKAGGIPVLAHPKFVKRREWLKSIVGYGIEGIEAISTYHDDSDVLFYLEFAKKHNLLITAGSDFHGPTSKPEVKLGGIDGNYYRYLSELKEHCLKMG